MHRVVSILSCDDLVVGFGNEVLLAFLFLIIFAMFFQWIFQNLRVPQCIARRLFGAVSFVEHGIQQTSLSIFRWFQWIFDNDDAFANEIEPSENNDSVQEVSRRYQDNTGLCSVCLQQQRYPTLSNCGHSFCAECILRCWHHQTTLINPLRCPLCRSTVRFLLPTFTTDADEAAAHFYASIVRFNHRFSNESRSLFELMTELPVLVPYMIRNMFSIGNMMWMVRFRIIVCATAAVIYALSPFDIIPEAVFGALGMLDDVFAIFLLLAYTSIAYYRFMAFDQS